MGFEAAAGVAEEGGIGEALSGFFSWLTGSTAGAIAARIVILAAVSRALSRRPGGAAGGSGVLSAEGRNLSVRQPIPPWQVVFGQARVGGDITFMFLGTDKKYLHIVITLACHVSEEIGDLWLDDEVVTSGMLNANGEVTSGKFSRYDQTARRDLLQGESSHVAAHPVASVQGVIVNGERDGSTSDSVLTDVSPAAPGPGEYSRSGDTFTFGSPITDGSIDYTESVFVPVCRIKKSLGGEAGQPFADLVSESEGKWTDAHRQTGHTKIYIRFNTSHLEAGAPAISAVVKGAKLYDPRTGLTTWSANTALAVLAYLTSTDFGLGAALTETGAAEFIAAANVCDESVSLAAGGSESRYKANGAFRLSERPVDILERLLSSMAGMLTQVSDTWRVFAGAYEAATLTLAEKDFAGPIQIEPMPPRDKWANGAKGVFVNPASNWQPTDFPAVVPTAPYLVEDGGEAMYADLDLSSFVTSSGQAQRLGRIEIRRRRSGLTVTALFKLTAWRAFTGHSVALTFAKYGWSAKEFTILDASFAVIQSGDGPALGVQLVLRETNAAIYSWSAEDQAQGTPPSTSLPNPFSAPAPGAPTVVETLYETSGSAGVKSRATVSWTPVTDPLVKSYEVSWKNVTDAEYKIVPVPLSTAVNIDDLEAGLFLFAVRSFNGIVKSAWSPYTTKTLLGLTAPPADATGFSVIASNGFAVARWDLSPDLDVKIGGRAIIRFSPLSSGATWEDGILISGTVPLPGFPGDTVMSPPLPLKTGTYLLKFRDSSGNYSANEASFVATEGMITGFTTLVTITEDAAFTGAKTDTVVSGSLLQLASVNLLQRTEEFDNAAWTKSNSSITANATTAPDGTVTADKLVEDATNNQHYATESISKAATPIQYTASIYAKPAGRNWFMLQCYNTTFAEASFNVSTGQIGITARSGWTVDVVSIEPAANGFYRCRLTFTTDSVSSFVFVPIAQNADGGTSYTGDGTSGVYLWGAQCELGPTMSAYDKLVADRIGSVITPAGSYAFAATDDRSTVAVRRFEATVKAVSFDTGDTIDSRTANIDTWDSIDGGTVNDCNAQLLASVSDDNITYKPFTPFHVADFSGRYSKFRLDLASANRNHNIAISQLRVAIKVP